MLYQLKVRGWPRTLGYLQAAGSVESGSTQPVRSEQEYQAQARYDYRVSDQDYEGQRVSPWVFLASHNLRFLLKQQVNAIEPSQAGRVQVLYNPRRPGKSFLLPPSKLGIALTCLIAIGPSIGYLLKF